ncbi:GNAT family N-acetyltransferase [Flexivirga alba]|uniref:GNAT family N-acetyltransferase n=1 Tax=Flexivirga alba TaxID=702742 RepID=A0ABW2AH11_9MICO
MRYVRRALAAGPADACVLAARAEMPGRTRLVGFGYWRRYSRSTLRPQADLERLPMATEFSGHGIGRALVRELIRTARDAGCEQLTIDFRGDNHGVERLYLSEGFTEYGRLRDFVAPAARRFDKVFQVLDLRRP